MANEINQSIKILDCMQHEEMYVTFSRYQNKIYSLSWFQIFNDILRYCIGVGMCLSGVL